MKASPQIAPNRAEPNFRLVARENERGDHGGARLDDERARGIQCIAREQVGKTGAESGGNTAVERPSQQRAEYHNDVARVQVAARRRRDGNDHRRHAAQRRQQGCIDENSEFLIHWYLLFFHILQYLQYTLTNAVPSRLCPPNFRGILPIEIWRIAYDGEAL